MLPVDNRQSPSNAWLLGATFGGYLVLAFLLRFWGNGVLFPANDIGVIGKPPTEAHWDAILVLSIGGFITVLNALQEVSRIEISRRCTRAALRLSCLAIVSLGVVGFGTRWIDSPLLHAAAVTVAMASLALGLTLAAVNVVVGSFRKRQLV